MMGDSGVKTLTVAQLRAILEGMPQDLFVCVNLVGNLAVYTAPPDDDPSSTFVGFIDFGSAGHYEAWENDDEDN